MNLVVPATIEEIIQRFDSMEKPFDEHVISADVNAARVALENPSDEERLGAWSEVLAFALVSSPHQNPWGTHFGPIGYGEKADGTPVYSPDIAGTPPEAHQHWVSRAQTVNHPLLKARYADLAWDMANLVGQIKRDPQNAQLAIDSYLAFAAMTPEILDKMHATGRALDLAIIIADQARTDQAKNGLMEHFRDSVASPPGMWWFAFNRLIGERRAGVTDADREELVKGADGFVALHGDPKSKHFDPNACRDAALRVLPVYRRQQKHDDSKRVNETVAKASEHAASLGDAMLAAAFLQTAWDFYQAAHLKDDARRVRILMQDKIGESRDEMKQIGHDFKVTKDEMDSFVASVVVDDLGKTLMNFAAQFLLKRDQLEKQVTASAEAAPLYAMISQQIMADNRVTAIIGSVKDDPQGRIMHQARFSLSFNGPWLQHCYNRLFEKHVIGPELIAAWANRHKVFEDMGLLIQGIHGWLHGDNVKAAHLLIPQMEVALRKIAEDIGLPVTKPIPAVKGASVAINMGDILFAPEMVKALGQNLTLHLQALYSDPRGFNYRNEVAHGLLDSGAFHDHMLGLIIQSFFMLGLWKEIGAAGQDKGEAD